jgi:hypothetical protein
MSSLIDLCNILMLYLIYYLNEILDMLPIHIDKTIG